MSGDKFYIILAGVCSAQIPNPSISDWAFKIRNYKSLLKWRNEDFEQKIQETRRRKLETWEQVQSESIGKSGDTFSFDWKKDMRLSGDEKHYLDKIEEYEQMAWFIDVVKMPSGKNFGELALINDAPRAATVQCVTNCFFATLGRSDYEKILRRKEVKKMK